MLGPLVEFGICLFQPVRIMAFDRSFNFINQSIDFSLIVWLNLIADQSQRAADGRQEFVTLQNRFRPDTLAMSSKA